MLEFYIFKVLIWRRINIRKTESLTFTFFFTYIVTPRKDFLLNTDEVISRPYPLYHILLDHGERLNPFVRCYFN